MKHVLIENRRHMLRLDNGDELFATLTSFCKEKEISAAYFSAIGAVKNLTLSFYDLPHKVYIDKDYKEDIEIVSLTGNIAQMDGKVVLHVHGVFSDKSFHCFGGHVKKLVTGATCEIFLIVLDGTLKREFNEETGLNLFK